MVEYGASSSSAKNKTKNDHSMNGEQDSRRSEPVSHAPGPDRQFEMVKKVVPYQFGSLWWGRDDLIHSAQPEFTEREDRIGHPLVSVKRDEMQDRMDIVPMFVGTSGAHLRNKIKNHCVQVRGLTAVDPGRICYFGSIVEPGLYDFDDLLDGVVRKTHSSRRPEKQDRRAPVVASEPVPWFELRVMHPNQDKPRVDANEHRSLETFCTQHGF